MKRTAVTVLVALSALCVPGGCQKTVLEWEELPSLPDPIGFAGAFAGVSDDALIVAGGANFPAGRPWDGHPKVWHDGVFVLTNPRGQWAKLDQKLPRPLAYGVSISGHDAVICLGGGDVNQHYADAFLIKRTAGQVIFEPLPPMPQPAAFFCGAALGESIYVAGGRASPTAPGTMKTFWRLDLSKPAGQRQWEQLPPWPGRPRMLATMAVQDGSLFLIGGVDLEPNGNGTSKRAFLQDAYRWDEDPAIGWRQIKDLCRPVAAAPTPALAMDPGRILVCGGDDGKHSFEVDQLKDSHPGFPRQIHGYVPGKFKWRRFGKMPKDPAQGTWPAVTTPGVMWKGRFVVPSGEARPGVRTPRVLWAKPIGWRN